LTGQIKSEALRKSTCFSEFPSRKWCKLWEENSISDGKNLINSFGNLLVNKTEGPGYFRGFFSISKRHQHSRNNYIGKRSILEISKVTWSFLNAKATGPKKNSLISSQTKLSLFPRTSSIIENLHRKRKLLVH
jgi:hypothetical protein